MWPFKRNYRTLNTISVSKSALVHNHKVLQQLHPEAQIGHVLKSNAYGHGLQTVAQVFDSLGAPFIFVDSLYEAYELLKKRVKTPICILGYTFPENFKVKRLPFTYAVYGMEMVEYLAQYQPGAKIHLFIDTGMNREGVKVTELTSFIKHAQKLNIHIEGLCSHLADADNEKNTTFNTYQVEQFKQALTICQDEGLEIKWRHISASAGTYKVVDPIFNLIRAGIVSYGVQPLSVTDADTNKLVLKPALRFDSTIVQVKEIAKNDTVGYGRTFTAPKNMRIGIVPAGYYEGIDRRLSNVGYVKVDNTICRILGRVSMNMTTIDLSEVPNAKVGDAVEMYSANHEDTHSFAQAAQYAQTIPYELLVRLSESVRRVIVD